MTPEQIQLLYQAAQSKFLSEEQRNNLTLENPYSKQGHVAEALQRAVAEINPTQARLWAKEAGAKPSLKAAAAQQGLVEVTPALQDEINRFFPKTETEQQRELVAQLTAKGNPYSKKESYDEQGKLQPAPFNLTACMQLEMTDPALASRLKAEANPEPPAHSYNEREQFHLQQHGFSIPTN